MQMNSSNIPKSRSPTPKPIKLEPQSPANQAPTPPASSSPSNSATAAAVVKKEEVAEEPAGATARADKKYPFKKSMIFSFMLRLDSFLYAHEQLQHGIQDREELQGAWNCTKTQWHLQ